MIQLHTDVGYTTRATSQFYSLDRGEQEAWEGQLHHDLALGKFEGKIKFPELNITLGKCQLNSLENTIDFDTHHKESLTLGKQKFKSEDLVIACQKKPIAQFKDFKVKANTNLNDKKELEFELTAKSEETVFAARPESRSVKIRALKKLKGFANS